MRHRKLRHPLENLDPSHVSLNLPDLPLGFQSKPPSHPLLHRGYVVEYSLPYRPRYPSDRSKEYLARLLAKLPALSLYRRSYHENLRFLSQYRQEVQHPPYPFWPQYNVKPLDHRRPSNRSYPDLLPRCSASSKAAPSSPSHRKSRSRRVGDIYPSLHRRYVLTSP